jgi:hypothetical protein
VVITPFFFFSGASESGAAPPTGFSGRLTHPPLYAYSGFSDGSVAPPSTGFGGRNTLPPYYAFSGFSEVGSTPSPTVQNGEASGAVEPQSRSRNGSRAIRGCETYRSGRIGISTRLRKRSSSARSSRQQRKRNALSASSLSQRVPTTSRPRLRASMPFKKSYRR